MTAAAAAPAIPYLPEPIASLGAIATNMSWSWSRDARRLFELLDAPLWAQVRHNPVALLRRADPARLTAAARDPRFLAIYEREVARLAGLATNDGTWFAAQYPDLAGRAIAYFCAEFAVHESVPIYSGGLGVLAGDHCKSASDLGIPLVAVGLYYGGGYFDQQIRADGWQEDRDERIDQADMPLEALLSPSGDRSLATVRLSGRDVHVGAWRMRVGRVPIYLLTTDIEQNHPDDRPITRRLYAPGVDIRLRQEWILGVGGVRVLRALGIDPAAWHANEGHAAFMMTERLRELMTSGVSGGDAVKQVRARGVFTTHTPVAAGHDAFGEDMVAQAAGPIWDEMGVSRDAIMQIGREPGPGDGRFHMTFAALRLSRLVNGVARKHGEVSRELWQFMWPGRPVDRVPIGSVTNGVHAATWMSDEIQALLDDHLGTDWQERRDRAETWRDVLSLDDRKLWVAHQALKRELVATLREQARARWTRAGASSNGDGASGGNGHAEGDVATRRAGMALGVTGAGTLLDPDVLTIGFARRFATYKRANLVFHDLDRLRTLLLDSRRPVQLVFAGKAHPADDPGKAVLQAVYEFTQDPELAGRVAFVEDYSMSVAAKLVAGVDVWLNVPRVPLEASGTSGMKAALNGIPHLSTLDGWWPEAYDGLNGWAIPLADRALSEVEVDAADTRSLYALLEQEVVPLYYARDERTGLPLAWIERMKHAICVAGQKFTTRRMLQNYAADYYVPAMRADAGVADDPPTA